MASVMKPEELAKTMKAKSHVLIMTGALCDEVEFCGKKLLDYAAEIAGKVGAPVAATANTIMGLKERDVPRVKKMWAAEVVNYMRYPWQDSVIDDKPDLLVLVGYNTTVAQSLVSAVVDAETMVLGNAVLEEATYSLPDASSLQQWQNNLEQLLNVL